MPMHRRRISLDNMYVILAKAGIQKFNKPPILFDGNNFRSSLYQCTRQYAEPRTNLQNTITTFDIGGINNCFQYIFINQKMLAKTLVSVAAKLS